LFEGSVGAVNVMQLSKLMSREKAMSFVKCVIVVCVASGLVFSVAGNASAAKKKKVTFEQAWKLCKAELDKDKVPTTTGMSNERYIRGGACMKKYGYDL
jgi:hypothetical protein